MHDQADQLRRLVRDAVERHGVLAPGGPLVAISAGQSGVGATTAACGLARELARLGKQVTLVDAHLARPAIAAAFDAKPRGTLAEVLAGKRRAVEILTPAAENIRVLAGVGDFDAAQLTSEACECWHAELTALTRHADVVLVDVGAGMNPWIDRLWLAAQQVLLVTDTQSTAMLEAYAAVKMSQFDRLAEKLQLVVTRCDAPADAACVHAGMTATCERFLGFSLRPPSVLPAFTPGDPAAYRRSLRLIAADLACDFRALAARMPARRTGGSRRSALGQTPDISPLGRQPTADS
jgi:flagellar biosynthesis protein FlhG